MSTQNLLGRLRLTAAASLAAVLLAQVVAQAPAAANVSPTQGGTATFYPVHQNLHSFIIERNLSRPSVLRHYWAAPDNETTGNEMLAEMATGETGYVSAVTFGAGLHVFYRNLTTLYDVFYLNGSWERRTVVSGDVASSPATMVSGETLYVTYVTTGGALRMYSGVRGLPSVGETVAFSCQTNRTPAIAAYFNQVHILARCGGSWQHFWRDVGSAQWKGETVGGSGMRPGDSEIALSTYNNDFVIAGNATDGTVWRWWHVWGQGWRQERIASQTASGRLTVGFFWGSWHAAWVRGNQRVVNAWVNGSTWSTEDLVETDTSSRRDVEAVAIGTTYYLVTVQHAWRRWRWQPATGWRLFL